MTDNQAMILYRELQALEARIEDETPIDEDLETHPEIKSVDQIARRLAATPPETLADVLAQLTFAISNILPCRSEADRRKEAEGDPAHIALLTIRDAIAQRVAAGKD
ncbi:MAG: hypothetical protein AcusKO_42220 [Acuticoccus sp.]